MLMKVNLILTLNHIEVIHYQNLLGQYFLLIIAILSRGYVELIENEKSSILLEVINRIILPTLNHLYR
ncbi:hypothetical protein H311_00162 [Anncaliia algerae PRA109]|nr:hypothetical protein H311_00162 [Anncaliia algerae PRA109]